MAEAARNWRTWCAFGALSFGACGVVCAQTVVANPAPLQGIQIQAPASGSLAGRLTDLHSAPLAGVAVVLHNQATGAEVRAVTAKNGGFRFAELEAGEYSLEADEPQLGHGRLDGILVSGGMEARVQAAMQFEPRAPELAEAATPGEIVTLARTTAAMPLGTLGTPAPALPTDPVSRVTLSTETLQMAATVDAAPMQMMMTAPRVTEAVQPLGDTVASKFPGSPAVAPKLLAPEAGHGVESLTVPAALPVPQMRAALETQSIAGEPALAVAVPRSMPLTRSVAPAVPPSLAIASGMKAVLVLGQMAFSPVAAAVQKVDPAAMVGTTTVTANDLQSLPVGGRRWQEFLQDTPGASAGPDATEASFRGSQESAEITIEGASTLLKFGLTAGSGSADRDAAGEGADQQSGMTQTMNGAWTGGRGFGVSEVAIHEVTVVSGNVEAEGMRSAGGRTSIETEHGGNALHGQGFFYDRQNNWGARNPFTQWVTETAPATLTYNPSGPPLSVPVFDNGPTGSPELYTPPDHEMVWGIGTGGHLRRDNLFWFAALDSYHRNDPGIAMVKHPYIEQTPTGCGTTSGCTPTTSGFFATPSAAQLTLLSAQLDLPSTNPEVEGLTAYSQMLETLAGLLGPAPRTAAQWTGFARIDWQAAERHSFTLEGIGADWNAPGGGLTRTSETYGNHSFGSSEASEEWLLARWEAYLTPNLLAVTQGSAGRTILGARPDTPSTFEQTLLNGNFTGQLPQIVVDSRYGFTIGNPSRFGQGSYPDEKLYHAQESLDWVHNRLLVKAGFELDHDADATSLLRNGSGTYTYSKVQNFVSDALVFEKYGFGDALDARNPHNCGASSTSLGSQPCYSSYSQTMGPTNWSLSTNDWAGYATAQWQANKRAVFSAGLRWELEQLPPPIAALANPELPFTEKLPSLGSNWGPRVSLAIGDGRGHWPMLRLGYGMYYGRVENATIESALTQTGSLKGDLSFFMRPSDDCASCAGGAPPFPYVFVGEPSSVVKPGVVGFAPNFRNPEVHQATVAIQQPLPRHLELTASAVVSLGRRLPVFLDTNFDPAVNPGTITAANPGITYTVCDEAPSGTGSGACGNLGLGPIKASTITVPFYASWPSNPNPSPNCPADSPANNPLGPYGWCNPNYQEIDEMTSKANSTYEAAMVRLTRYGRRGLSLHAHYTYAHAMDWNPNASPLDPADFNLEYGTSNQDVRHAAAAMLMYEAPWKLNNFPGRMANGWMLSGIGQFHSGLPYTMRVSGSLPEESASTATITGLRPGLTGAGGDSRVYGYENGNLAYNIGRNSFRYPSTWKADARLGKKFDVSEERELELFVESFNLFNHQNVTEIETTGYTIDSGSTTSPPTLNFLTGLKTSSTTGVIPGFGQPLNINATNFYRERQIQLGLRMRF